MNTSRNTTKKISEKEYRLIPRDSYSSLALFSANKRTYQKKYIIGEKVEEEISPALLHGSLVDCLLFTPEELDERFVVGSFTKPTPQMAEFTRNLVKRVIQNDKSERKEDFPSLMVLAFNDTKYDNTGAQVAFGRKGTTFETVQKAFKEECGQYYDHLIDTTVGGKLLVGVEDYSKAELSVSILKRNTNTGYILMQENDGCIEVHKQLVILYELNDTPMKSMLDFLIVDHCKKEIRFWDLKTTHNVEEFNHSFIKFRYYIQLGVYSLAVQEWAKQQGLENYVIYDMGFIVSDSYNYMHPLVYETDKTMLQLSLRGFMRDGRLCRGVWGLLDRLKWHKENGIWNMDMDNYNNRGVCKIDLLNESRESEERDS